MLIFLQFRSLQVYSEKQTSLVIHELLIWITDNNWKSSKEPFADLQWQQKNLYYESSRLFLQIIMQWKCMHVRWKSGGHALASSWRVNFSSTISVVVTGDNQRTNPIHSSKTYFFYKIMFEFASHNSTSLSRQDNIFTNSIRKK